MTVSGDHISAASPNTMSHRGTIAERANLTNILLTLSGEERSAGPGPRHSTHEP